MMDTGIPETTTTVKSMRRAILLKLIILFIATFCLLHFLWTFQRHNPPQRKRQPTPDAPSSADSMNKKNFEEILDFSHLFDVDHYQVDSSTLWPNSTYPEDDRIIQQLLYVSQMGLSGKRNSVKTIFIYDGLGFLPEGDELFKNCPVKECRLSADYSGIKEADALVFSKYIPSGYLRQNRSPGQVWILHLKKPPSHTPRLGYFLGLVNWTISYRRDSTLVDPVLKFVHFSEEFATDYTRDLARRKTKQAAWFASTCDTHNQRVYYANSMAANLGLDVYGACGTSVCPKQAEQRCDVMLSNVYKFYLAFERENSKDLITEVLSRALRNDVIPIVMGPERADYEHVAPPGSFIHVDDFENAHALTEYLLELDRNNTAYNEYFRWKNRGAFINTDLWCRLCGMLHTENIPEQIFPNIDYWWHMDELPGKK